MTDKYKLYDLLNRGFVIVFFSFLTKSKESLINVYD